MPTPAREDYIFVITNLPICVDTPAVMWIMETTGTYRVPMEALMATEKTNRVISVELNHSIKEMEILVRGVDKPLRFHLERTSEQVRLYAMMLGFKNRIVDTAAKSFDTTTNKPASPQEKYDAMQAIIAHLESGTEQWATRQAPRSSNEDALLVVALMEVLGKSDSAKVAAAVKSWDAAKRAAVRNREDVKAVIDRMIAESAADVDTDEMLAELM